MKRNLKLLISFFICAVILTACYSDKEDVLYRFPQTSLVPCDTANVTYSQTIATIMTSVCNVCHNTSNASGGWATDNYNGLKTVALNGKFVGSITHSAGFSPMPKGGNSITDCEISKIKSWINNGCQNN